MNRTPPKITLDTPIGPDVNLDAEDVRLADGTRLTNHLADKITVDILRAAGRPSLTAPGVHSPSVTLRFPAASLARLDAEASKRGVRRSDIVREAVEAFLPPISPRERG